MRYTDATSITKISSLATGVPPSLSYRIFSFLGIGGKGLTKAQRRKLARRRYRMFVDNIIMHHKRIHDRNRELVIKQSKERLDKKKPTLSKSSPSNSPKLSREDPNKWRSKFTYREKINGIRGRIEARKVRARSRWISISQISKAGDNALMI